MPAPNRVASLRGREASLRDRVASLRGREASLRDRLASRREDTWPAEHQVLAAALYDDKPNAYRILRRLEPDRLAAYLDAVRSIEYLASAIFVLHPYQEPGGRQP